LAHSPQKGELHFGPRHTNKALLERGLPDRPSRGQRLPRIGKLVLSPFTSSFTVALLWWCSPRQGVGWEAPPWGGSGEEETQRTSMQMMTSKRGSYMEGVQLKFGPWLKQNEGWGNSWTDQF